MKHHSIQIRKIPFFNIGIKLSSIFILMLISSLYVNGQTNNSSTDKKVKMKTMVPFVNKYVVIKNVHSGKNLCTMHWSKDPKSNKDQEAIIQYSYTGDPTHIWLIKPAGAGLYIIENAHSGKNLCTMHWSKDPKSNKNQEAIIQYSYTGDPTHKWRFKDLGNGQWSIVNAHSGKNLCTMHWSKDPKSSKDQEAIIQYSYTGDPTHKWTMKVVSKP